MFFGLACFVLVKVQWSGISAEMEWEKDNVCGWLTEFEYVGITGLYASRVGAKCQDNFCEAGLIVFCVFSGQFHLVSPFCFPNETHLQNSVFPVQHIYFLISSFSSLPQRWINLLFLMLGSQLFGEYLV